jgi:hypothetical protein
MTVTVQQDYRLYYKVGKPGQLADQRDSVKESFAAVEEIKFGMGVTNTGSVLPGVASDKQVKKMSAATDEFIGISLEEWTQEQRLTGYPGNIADSEGKYEQYDMLPVMRKGLVWVFVFEDVLVNDPVYVLFEGGNQGYFRKSAAAGAVRVQGAMFRSAALSGELALLELNIPTYRP